MALAVLRQKATAEQEEAAFCQFVEDFLNFCFIRTKKDSDEDYVNLMVLMALP